MVIGIGVGATDSCAVQRPAVARDHNRSVAVSVRASGAISRVEVHVSNVADVILGRSPLRLPIEVIDFVAVVVCSPLIAVVAQ